MKQTIQGRQDRVSRIARKSKKEIVVLVTVSSNTLVHKYWRNFLLQPPKNIRYINVEGKPITFGSPVRGSLPSPIIHWLYTVKRKIPFLNYAYKLFTEYRYSRMIDRQDADIIYCLNGIIYRGEKPWIVDIENPSVLFGFNGWEMRHLRRRIEAPLLRENCKGVLPYSRVGGAGFTGYFDKRLTKKCHVACNIVTPPRVTTPLAHKGFRILFTGSINIGDNFYARGGREVVHAFIEFSKRHPDAKLVMRCSVPAEERKLLEGKNVEIHEEILSSEQFDELFRKSDVYLFPAYIGYALSVLEAMSYGLPIVASDLMENGEPIVNGVNGFKITPKAYSCRFPFLPDYYFTERYDLMFDEKYILRIVDKLETLYADPALRKKMRGANLEKIRRHYTIDAKNRVLSKVFRAAL